MSKAIDVSDLPGPLITAIESLVKTYRDCTRISPQFEKSSPPIGWLGGKWEMPDSFFDPLPGDVIELFQGGEETE